MWSRTAAGLIVATEAVERDRIEALLDVVREASLSLRPRAREADRLMEAEGLFRAAYQNLRRYGHELYPALLKMIASFYEENDTDPEKRSAILGFLEAAGRPDPHLGGLAAQGA